MTCRSLGLRATGPWSRAEVLWYYILPIPWHRDRVGGSVPCAVTAGGSAEGGGCTPPPAEQREEQPERQGMVRVYPLPSLL